MGGSGTGFDVGGSSWVSGANQILDPADLFGARAGEAQKQAIEDAGIAQREAASENILFQKEMFEKNIELQEPWRQAGMTALTAIQGTPDFEFTAESFEQLKDPSYEFRKSEGINALDRSAASRGRLLSGAQDKAVTRYASDLASQEYGNAFNRAKTTFDTNLNTQKSLAGVGQDMTNQMTAQGDRLTQGVTTQTSEMANALAQQNIQTANANTAQQQQASSTAAAGVGILAAFSDRRLKDNITFVGLENGHKIYDWVWKDDSIKDDTRGVIAQEVQKYMPSAIITDDSSGYLKVNYAMLGLKYV